ncbi:DNA polymerase III subunit alpha, partial [Campylobacter lari]
DFIDIKHGRKAATYAFDDLKPILENTYGVIVYQEQVMQIVQKIGGFSLGGADNVRRAMGKKKREILDNLKAEYLEGAKKQGYDEKKADDLFELILKFAEYGFNKSHSAAYALITFQTAYLKTYYPSEFMAALLTSEENNVDKVAKYIEEMKRMNIKLLPPSVNKAQREFSATKLEDGSEAIIYGLGAIKS